jgi:hypothetical protein
VLDAESHTERQRGTRTDHPGDFPEFKELSDFNFSLVPSLNAPLVSDLACYSFIDRREVGLAVGPPDAGSCRSRVRLGREPPLPAAGGQNRRRANSEFLAVCALAVDVEPVRWQAACAAALARGEVSAAGVRAALHGDTARSAPAAMPLPTRLTGILELGPVFETDRGERWSGRRGSNSRPLPWQGSHGSSAPCELNIASREGLGDYPRQRGSKHGAVGSGRDHVDFRLSHPLARTDAAPPPLTQVCALSVHIQDPTAIPRARRRSAAASLFARTMPHPTSSWAGASSDRPSGVPTWLLDAEVPDRAVRLFALLTTGRRSDA